MSMHLRFYLFQEKNHCTHFKLGFTKIWHTSFGKFLNYPVSEESLKLEGSSQNDRSLTKERVVQGSAIFQHQFYARVGKRNSKL